MALRATRRAALACSRGQAGLDARVAAVLGGQWGDEGKGKLADVLAKNYDVVGRFNGGANAGCVAIPHLMSLSLSLSLSLSPSSSDVASSSLVFCLDPARPSVLVIVAS